MVNISRRGLIGGAIGLALTGGLTRAAMEALGAEQKRAEAEKRAEKFGAKIIWEEAAVVSEIGPETKQVVIMHTGYDEGPMDLSGSAGSNLEPVYLKANKKRAFIQHFTDGRADADLQYTHIKHSVERSPEGAEIILAGYSVGDQFLAKLMADKAFLEKYGSRIKGLILISPLTGAEDSQLGVEAVLRVFGGLAAVNLCGSEETVAAAGKLAELVKENGGEVVLNLGDRDGLVKSDQVEAKFKKVGIKANREDREHGIKADLVLKAIGWE